jgi:hypothetical protein
VEDGLIYVTVRSETEKTKRDWVIRLVRWMVPSSGCTLLQSYFQVWGFTIKDGERRFARRYKFTTKERPEPIYLKLYYDYREYLHPHFLVLTELALS